MSQFKCRVHDLFRQGCPDCIQARTLERLSADASLPPSHTQNEETPTIADDRGLSIDMTAADRLREWARLLMLHGDEINTWCWWGSIPSVVSKMQIMATEIEHVVHDVGSLRAEVARLRAERESFFQREANAYAGGQAAAEVRLRAEREPQARISHESRSPDGDGQDAFAGGVGDGRIACSPQPLRTAGSEPADSHTLSAAGERVPPPQADTRPTVSKSQVYAVIEGMTTEAERNEWGISPDRPIYLSLTRALDHLRRAAASSPTPEPEQKDI